MSITVKNITKLYGEQKALDNVSMEIKTGEIVGFIGPNGAGKSTLMKILTGYIPFSDGEAFVAGMNVLDQSIEIRQKVGYLPENNPLYLDMYVLEYLEFVAGLYKMKLNKSERIEKIIEKTGLAAEQHKKIEALSKGYRQRDGLAQALLHDPDILILDEPTSGLDPNQIVEIRNLIQELGSEKTVMLSTHIMQEVEAICDRIIIINEGVIIANDLTKNIKTITNDNQQTVLVEFDKPVQEKLLNSIKGVMKVVNVNANTWLLKSEASVDVRSDLFKFAVQNDFTVLSLQKQEKSLEEVFQGLTKKGQ